MSLRDELKFIYDQYGQLTPSLLVEVARPEEHPLHYQIFDKTVPDAAEAYYRERARELIRKVKVVYRPADGDEEEGSVRAFQAIRQDDDSFRYEPVERVATDPMLKAIVLRDMEREWQQMYQRYSQFEEFAEIVKRDLQL